MPESPVLQAALSSGCKDLEGTPTIFANYLNLRETELFKQQNQDHPESSSQIGMMWAV